MLVELGMRDRRVGIARLALVEARAAAASSHAARRPSCRLLSQRAISDDHRRVGRWEGDKVLREHLGWSHRPSWRATLVRSRGWAGGGWWGHGRAGLGNLAEVELVFWPYRLCALEQLPWPGRLARLLRLVGRTRFRRLAPPSPARRRRGHRRRLILHPLPRRCLNALRWWWKRHIVVVAGLGLNLDISCDWFGIKRGFMSANSSSSCDGNSLCRLFWLSALPALRSSNSPPSWSSSSQAQRRLYFVLVIVVCAPMSSRWQSWGRDVMGRAGGHHAVTTWRDGGENRSVRSSALLMWTWTWGIIIMSKRGEWMTVADGGGEWRRGAAAAT